MYSTAILLVCACLASPARAAVLATDLEAKVGANYQPLDEDERAIWKSLERLEELIRHSPQRLIAPDLEAYTRQVVERLIGRPAPDLRIYLVRDATFNAAMYPSGMMIVHTGLLARVRDEAQFAAVLGHESGHYFRKHSVDRYRAMRQKYATIAVTDAAARGSGYGWAPGADSWDVITKITTTSMYKFSRDQESEADAYGIMLLARAGYPPRAASEICKQILDERRASAVARGKQYLDRASLALTHPATERRVIDLADTAGHLAREGDAERTSRDAWDTIIRPYLAMLLHEQVSLNDPGASLYLLENRADDGWTALLRFNEGEVYRLRDAAGDDAKSAAAYAAATTLPDTPPEAWRAHGYALLKAGNRVAGDQALAHYLALAPEAADAAMVRSGSNYPPMAVDGNGGEMATTPAAPWKKLPAGLNETRWEDLWTRNGPQLDRLALIGLPEGKSLIRQLRSADQRVPLFRADMTVQDLASMVEISYRVNGVAVFDFDSIAPVDFLGGPGIELRYSYASGIGFPKKGRCVMRIVDHKLFAMRLEGVATRAFDAVAVEFDELVNRAQLRGKGPL